MNNMYIQPKKINNAEFAPKQEINLDIQPKKIKGNLQRLPYKDLKILTIVFSLILIGQLLRKNKYSFSLDLNKIIKNSECREILSTIIPYLDIDEQQNVYPILGLLEALDIIYGVADGTYQELRISNTILFNSEKERIAGILKAIKPYISESSKELVENISKAQTMSSQLARNISIYKSKKLSGQSLIDNLEPIYESLNILRPIIPPKEYEQIDKIITMIKLFGSPELKKIIPSYEKEIKDNSIDSKTIQTDIPSKETDETLETFMKIINLFSQSLEK